MRFLLVIMVLVSAPLVSGLYGSILDEVSFYIQPEFFTKFRLTEYDYTPNILPWEVLFSGFDNALLIGFLIALPLCVLLFFHKDASKAARYSMTSYGIILLVTILFGIIGFITGKYILTEDVVKWELPDNITDKTTFLAIETMNNFTYMGGTIGMLIAIYWQLNRKCIDDKTASNSA